MATADLSLAQDDISSGWFEAELLTRIQDSRRISEELPLDLTLHVPPQSRTNSPPAASAPDQFESSAALPAARLGRFTGPQHLNRLLITHSARYR